MKITIINHSDTRGGAAVASMRLMNALRQAGADARMIVMHKASNSPWVEEAKPKWLGKSCFLREHLDIFLHNGFSRKRLFQASIATCGFPLASHPWVKEADLVVLGWINQGMLSLQEIKSIKAPLAWIMHDMWNCTGVCHHAGKCNGYMSECGNCPLLSSDNLDDLSHSAWIRKHDLYTHKSITFIAVSNWLASKCKESKLMSAQSVEVIPNAFPVEDYYSHPKQNREEIGLPLEHKLIMIASARLDDPIKGLPLAIEALNAVAQQRDDVAAVLCGDIRNRSALEALKMPFVHLGPLSLEQMRDVYAHASVVMSSSHYETLPTTLIEGMAAGCIPVAFDQGGQSDIFDHLSSGYLASYPSPSDLASGIIWALNSDINPLYQQEEVAKRFGSQAIAKTFLKTLF